MKVARLYTFKDIRIENIPLPDIGPDEALIKVKASGICSGDVMSWYIEKKAPLVLGHEPAGEIIKVGKNVKYFSRGNRVFVHHHTPCMECTYCKRGDYVQCDEWRRSGIIPGGISEYILVPEGNLKRETLRLPDSINYEDATLIEPTACVIKSLRRSRIKKGDTVLIIGLGVMGILHLLLAPYFGSGKVVGADMVEFRLKKAEEFGAWAVVDVKKEPLREAVSSLTNGRGAEIVVVGPNTAEAMNVGIECVAPGGTVVFFTPVKPDGKLTIDTNYLYFNDINIVSSYSCGPDDTRNALKFIEKGIVKAERLITHRFSIDEIELAYRTVAKATESLKVLIVFD